MGDLTLRTEDDFIFSDAFIGCYVQRLMKQADMVRLANCADLQSARTLLMEFGYDDPKETDVDDIEWFIRHEQSKLYEMIFRNLPGRTELAPHIYPYDYHNIKVCLKAEMLGITPTEDQLISTGDRDWKMMVAMIRDRNFGTMRPVMRDAIMEALDVYGRTGDPQEIDLILDKACYKDMVLGAQETESQFLVDLMRTQIDTLNLKTFVRLKAMKRPWTFFKKVFLTEGFLTEEFFTGCYEETLQQVADRLIHPGMRDALKEGARALEETGSFVRVEKLLTDVVMDENRKAKDYLIGIEPVAGYWYAKEQEIDNVRIILNGILIQADPDYLLQFLGKTYSD
ncbi:MAG: V-type ATPase subunit [Eubacterium sp.]|nr:V-type ATPase subunit [Eubacterium sp.]